MDFKLSVLDLSPISSDSNGVRALCNTLEVARLAGTYRSMQVIGDPQTVRTSIEELAQHTVTDEVMVATNVYGHTERLSAYERLAEVFGIATPDK